MKNLAEIKNEVARRRGYPDWENFVMSIIDEATLEYAKQCCEAQRESDAANARVTNLFGFLDDKSEAVNNVQVDRNSILNNPLITDNL